MGVNYSGSYATPRLDLGEAFKEYMFTEADFISMRAFGSFMTPKKKATFSKITRESLLRPVDTKRAPRTAYNRDNFDGADQAYACEERGHEVPLDDGERSFYASDFDAEASSSEVAWWRVMYDIEQATRDILFDGTTNFTTANGHRTDVSTAWSTATADIKNDVVTACETVRARTGMKPNSLIIGAGVLPFLLRNDDLINAIQYTSFPSVEAQLGFLANWFGLDQILVGKSVYNSADKGQTFSGSDVWDNAWASVARVAAPGAPLMTPCVGRTMVWEADTPEAIMVEEYREEQTRSNIYRCRAFTDELLIDKSFAQLLDIAG